MHHIKHCHLFHVFTESGIYSSNCTRPKAVHNLSAISTSHLIIRKWHTKTKKHVQKLCDDQFFCVNKTHRLKQTDFNNHRNYSGIPRSLFDSSCCCAGCHRPGKWRDDCQCGVVTHPELPLDYLCQCMLNLYQSVAISCSLNIKFCQMLEVIPVGPPQHGSGWTGTN